MERALNDFMYMLRTRAGETRFSLRTREEGRVISVGDGIVELSGLRDAKLYELIEFGNGNRGIAFDLNRESAGVVLLKGEGKIKAGDCAYGTNRVASIDAGDELLGRVLDALGNPIDGNPRPGNTIPYPVEREAPAIIQRDYVAIPLLTGIKVIDAMLPIGRGQRELIIGDPSTGKTSIGVDAIISQKDSDVVSVYVAIGLKKSHILKIVDELRAYGDFSRTIVVVAHASDSLGLQYIAPYSAMAVAEYFLDRGRDVLVVFDDLTKHAEAYRSLSLLLKRPPGREAYPGDIFFLHARLLERAAKLGEKYGGGSITALPVVETQQGRISSYIPTNLISITDGQIYLDALLFNKGFRPAIDVGRSVSRIGGRAQTQAMKEATSKLKIDYSRFLEAEVFTKFGAHLEEETARLLGRGARLREILKQPRFHPLSLGEEVMTFLIVNEGLLDQLEIGSVETACGEMLKRASRDLPEIMKAIGKEGRLQGPDREKVRGFIAGGRGEHA